MNKETVMAFVRLVCSVAASAGAMAGFALDADALYTGALCVIALATFIWSWWKNNNVTEAARAAQEVLDKMKAESINDEYEEESYD